MLFNNKNLIISGALAISFLLSIPRILIVVFRQDLADEFGLSYGEIVFRSGVLFCFAWTVLSYNIRWKNSWSFRAKQNPVIVDVVVNAGFWLLWATIITLVKPLISSYVLDAKSYFFVAFFTFFFVLVVLLLVSWLVNLTNRYQQNLFEKEQAKRKALGHQLEALRAQVNPHFLFNTLNSLNALIRQKSDKASLFVDKLSWLLRATLQQSDKDYITIQEELDYLDAYIFLQKERFGEKLKVEIDLPEQVLQERIPSFSLQLLVENAIKHNVISSRQPLTIRVFIEGRYVVVSNPIQKRRDAVESIGKGLSNLSTRFKLLKKEDVQLRQTESEFQVKLPVL